jgi:hypothetical protein
MDPKISLHKNNRSMNKMLANAGRLHHYALNEMIMSDLSNIIGRATKPGEPGKYFGIRVHNPSL